MNGTRRLLELVRTACLRNEAEIAAAAALVRRTVAADGLIRPAGAGHSLASVLELFYRAGGLAAVRPMWHPRVLPLNGAEESTIAEREPGLGRSVAEAAEIDPDDLVVVFSNSGINAYPVEVAQVARERGAAVIAVTSTGASKAATARVGARLFEMADVVLNTGTPAGDVTWPLDAPVTAAASSLLATALWLRVQQEIVDANPAVSLWRSANVSGNDEFNLAATQVWAQRVPEL